VDLLELFDERSIVSLQLHNLSVIQGDDVILQDINYTFLPGKIYILIGRTTSGKTSLMRALSGLLPLTDGEITFDGKNLDSTPIWKRGVAMVYQQFINYPNRTVLGNVEFPLRRAGLSKAESREKALAVIEKVGLSSFLDRKPSELSGGQQQRVAIARSLVRGTRILLLDEPLMNLDYKLREQLREEFRELFTTAKESVTIYATTEPSEALLLGDELLVMHEGRVIQAGIPVDVYENPNSIHVAQIVNDPPMTILPATMAGGEISIGKSFTFKTPKHLKSFSDGDYQIGIRASEVKLGGTGVGSEEGTVSLVEVSGSETLIYVLLAEGEVVLQLEGIHDYGIGERLNVSIDPDRLFLFDTSGVLCAAPGN
jgi:glycerol transport system ATP-binding protein